MCMFSHKELHLKGFRSNYLSFPFTNSRLFAQLVLRLSLHTRYRQHLECLPDPGSLAAEQTVRLRDNEKARDH